MNQLHTQVNKMNERLVKEFGNILRHNALWFLVGAFTLIGTISLLYYIKFPEDHIISHFARDLGIAFLISALVSILFETYARFRFETELMSDVSGIVISDLSRPDIWKEVKEQVLEKLAIREKFYTELKLLNHQALAEGQMVLEMKTTYELKGLHSLPSKISISHFNDMHLKIDQAQLPCFVSIDKDGVPWKLIDCVKDGKFEAEVDVPAKDAKNVKRQINLERREIIYVPGIHYLTMTEMTKGITLKLTGVPDSIETIYSMRPHHIGQRLVLNEESKHPDTLLLPGQGVELLFKRKQD